MIEVELTKGYIAIIDDCDADLAEMKWHTAQGYARRVGFHVKGAKTNTTWLHRVVLERTIGRQLQVYEVCDHINGITTDNRRSNLRTATKSQNAQNQSSRKSKSGYRGVVPYKSQWKAQIKVGPNILRYGPFATPEEAYIVYCEAAKKYRGEFARFD